ncbi:hypothetical protein [Paenibacillus abyssi]|uniref:Spore coat protein D n=1 Tax=Paenibacillus abyssi TaxID=1340531 RepID=A0A917CZG6_9BACL|nr:hypothetical protein [Paenibacillus abyssi]GGG03280.1 hypothetical protein GCM10010916_20460 [Paenibacillus abyssi]
MSCYHCPPAGPIYDPPRVVYNDYFYPQIVPVIHTVEIVNRHHCVPIPKHITQFKVRDEFCTISSRKPLNRR